MRPTHIQSKRLLPLFGVFITIFVATGCKHTESYSSVSYEDQNIEKPKYTPRQQKDVREVIKILHKPI